MKNIYVRLQMRNGEYENILHILAQTRCKDINFAAEWLAAHWYSNGTLGDSKRFWSFYYGEVTIEVLNVKELTDAEYEIVKNVLIY